MTGSGTVDDPYLIYDVNDLQAVENDLSAYYELANDIDASETSTWNAGAGFVAIGRTSPYFTGQFNGNNHTIGGLYIDRATRCQGLFGRTDGAVIEDVILTDVAITTNGISGDAFGGLIGRAYNTNISNCHVSGSVATRAIAGRVGDCGGMLCGEYYSYGSSCSITDCSTGGTLYSEGGSCDLGGLVGLMWSNTAILVTDCYSSVDIETTGIYIGGFIGQPYGANIEITDCYATGNITNCYTYSGGFIGGTWTGGSISISQCYATGNVVADSAAWDIGGFIGWGYETSIERCFATGDVTANYSRGGGFIGTNEGSITNCYARGKVTGQYAGGFVGENDGSLDKCYATGHITETGVGNCGGLAALLGGTAATASFWDTEATGLDTSDSGTGKTTAQMKNRATFILAGWDFTTIWSRCPGVNAVYPCLIGVTPSCRYVSKHHMPTHPTEPNRGKVLSRMGSL